MGSHMLGRGQGQELHEGDLHGQQSSEHVEDIVSCDDLVEVLFFFGLVSDQGEEHVDWDDVDDEGVATPGRHHVEVG